jgi:signal transduction histidine kinase
VARDGIIVTIHYERRQLRLTVRDDGQGSNAETTARRQRAGHFGLPGMRAAIMRGQLDVRSQPGFGTEIQLRVPGSIAYRASARRSWWSRPAHESLTSDRRSLRLGRAVSHVQFVTVS